MTIFPTLYEIMGITGGEIDLRFQAGATVALNTTEDELLVSI